MRFDCLPEPTRVAARRPDRSGSLSGRESVDEKYAGRFRGLFASLSVGRESSTCGRAPEGALESRHPNREMLGTIGCPYERKILLRCTFRSKPTISALVQRRRH